MSKKTCPKCGMEIPSNAQICPYCRSRLLNDWGLPAEVDDLFGSVKKGFQQGSSNNGCMVVLPLILFFAASAFYLINTFI
jgi:hypothetical protein